MSTNPSEAGTALAPRAAGALAVYSRIADPSGFCSTMAKAFTALTNCTVDQGAAIALTALCEGLSPMDFVRKYHVIQGRPTMRADAMRAEFAMNHGGDFEIVELSPDAVAVRATNSRKRTRDFRLTWQEAQQELWPWKRDKGPGTKFTQPTIENLKDNWSTPRGRQNMMLARVTSEAMRAMCPELVAGVYTPEEITDVIDVESSVLAPALHHKTTAEILQAASAEPAHATGEVATASATVAGEDDAIDAEYETAGDGSETTAAANETTVDPNEPGTCTEDQREELKELVELLGAMDNFRKALEKRGASTARNLSINQAEEILDKLRAAKRNREGANRGN